MTTAKRIKSDLRVLHNCSYYDAEIFLHDGRISQDGFEAWSYFWGWSAFRYSGPEHDAQTRYAEKHGWDALWARHERTKAAYIRAIA